MSYIRFENLYKSFGSNEVLKNINLEIEKGQLVTLLGPSGCGKSTLLRCLAGLETVTSGKVYLDDRDITDVSPKNRDIGMVFQQYSLFPNMTVEQNVAFGLKMKKYEKSRGFFLTPGGKYSILFKQVCERHGPLAQLVRATGS